MKLISMTDFVLEQELPTYLEKEEFEEVYYKIHNYAKFLKQPLELWMFVPCDENGNVLTKSTMSEDTCEDDCNHKNCVSEMNECIKYQQAKDRVLFEGFEYDNKMEYWHNKHISFDEEFCENKTIEDLIQYNLTLYQTAIKQL